MMAAMPLQCESCPVRERAACAVLHPDERGELAEMGRHRTFERGETVFAPGDNSAGFATLVSGALKMTTVDADGHEHIVALVHPAGFVGQLFSASEEFEI